ncbi:hypothetical protein B0H13DRAFT_2326260 [Mycena leptocephala]|nr:hypothetical protein B0H13DRAFT_2326260 [Mycena leptocephala]
MSSIGVPKYQASLEINNACVSDTGRFLAFNIVQHKYNTSSTSLSIISYVSSALSATATATAIAIRVRKKIPRGP